MSTADHEEGAEHEEGEEGTRYVHYASLHFLRCTGTAVNRFYIQAVIASSSLLSRRVYFGSNQSTDLCCCSNDPSDGARKQVQGQYIIVTICLSLRMRCILQVAGCHHNQLSNSRLRAPSPSRTLRVAGMKIVCLTH